MMMMMMMMLVDTVPAYRLLGTWWNLPQTRCFSVHDSNLRVPPFPRKFEGSFPDVVSHKTTNSTVWSYILCGRVHDTVRECRDLLVSDVTFNLDLKVNEQSRERSWRPVSSFDTNYKFEEWWLSILVSIRSELAILSWNKIVGIQNTHAIRIQLKNRTPHNTTSATCKTDTGNVFVLVVRLQSK